jgi:hypothetical protein
VDQLSPGTLGTRVDQRAKVGRLVVQRVSHLSGFIMPTLGLGGKVLYERPAGARSQ